MRQNTFGQTFRKPDRFENGWILQMNSNLLQPLKSKKMHDIKTNQKELESKWACLNFGIQKMKTKPIHIKKQECI